MADVRRSSSARATWERSSSGSTQLREKIVPSSGWTEDSNGRYLLVDLPDFKKEEVKVNVDIKAGTIIVSGQRQVNEKKSEYFELSSVIPPNSDIDNITGKFDGVLFVTIPKVATPPPAEEGQKEPEIKNHQNVVQEGAATATATATPTATPAPTPTPTATATPTPTPTPTATPAPTPTPTSTDNPTPPATDIPTPTATLGEPSIEQKNDNLDDLRPKNGEVKNELSGNRNIFFSAENIRKWEGEDGILSAAMEVLRKNKGIVATAVVAFSLGLLISRKFQSGREYDKN